jgi:ABC-type branched-subunit amino acid transport system ATPase component
MIGSANANPGARLASEPADVASGMTSLAGASHTARAPVLTINGIEARYGKKIILHGVSLVAQPGAMTALLGVNGAGKSTLLKVIMGLLPPTAGTLHIGNRDITRLPTPERAALGIGYLTQGGRVFPNLSVRENIAIATQVMPRARRRGAAEAALAGATVLRGKANLRAGLLSGGERHALAFAMLLACGPKLVLLDEPSAGIAPAFARAFLGEIVVQTRERGITALLVEQNVGLALEMADHAVALVSGCVAMTTSTPSEWRSERVLNAILQKGTRQ